MILREILYNDIDNYQKLDISDINTPYSISEYLQIVYVRSGNITVKIEQNSYNVASHELCVIMPNTAFLMRCSEPSDISIVYVNSHMASEFVIEYGNIVPTNPVIKDKHNDIFVASIVKDANKYEILAIFNSIFASYSKQNISVNKRNKLSLFICDVLSYINSNYDKEATIEDMSATLGYATHYVSSLLCKTFDVSFSTLLNEKRIAKATKLLATSDLSIIEISRLCGFGSVRSLNRNFLLITGMTPTTYREK